MDNKKAQSALELILILLFVFIMIGFIMYIIGSKTIDLQNEEKERELDDFAKSITSEFEILVKVEDGYYREIEIPDYLLKKFNFTIDRSYLIIRSMDRDSENSTPYYYYIPGDLTPNLVVRNIAGVNKTYLIVEKKDLPEQEDYLYLE